MTLLLEYWKPFPRFPRFEVSVTGNIRHILNRKVRRFAVTNSGYRVVRLRATGKMHNIYMHHAIAATFLGDRPKGWHINHKNGNKSDNRLSNLEYVTPSENARHALGLAKSVFSLRARRKLANEDYAYIKANPKSDTHIDLATQFGISRPYVTYIINGKAAKFLNR